MTPMTDRIKMSVSIAFIAWMVAFTTAFVSLAVVLDSLGAGTVLSLTAGVIFSNISDEVVGYFTDWYLAEQTVDEVES